MDARYNFEQTCCESNKAREHLFSPFESMVNEVHLENGVNGVSLCRKDE